MPDYNFPSSRKVRVKESRPFNKVWLLVFILIAFNAFTVAAAHNTIEHYKAVEDQKFTDRVNELERFYYGFCIYTKDLGLADGLDYQRLCGDL